MPCFLHACVNGCLCMSSALMVCIWVAVSIGSMEKHSLICTFQIQSPGSLAQFVFCFATNGFFHHSVGYSECSLAAQCQCKLEWAQRWAGRADPACWVGFIWDESEGRNLFTGESYFTASTVFLRSLSLFLFPYCTFCIQNAEATAWHGFHRMHITCQL